MRVFTFLIPNHSSKFQRSVHTHSLRYEDNCAWLGLVGLELVLHYSWKGGNSKGYGSGKADTEQTRCPIYEGNFFILCMNRQNNIQTYLASITVITKNGKGNTDTVTDLGTGSDTDTDTDTAEDVIFLLFC